MNDLRLSGVITNDLVLRKVADGTSLVTVHLDVAADQAAGPSVIPVHVWGSRADDLARTSAKGDRVLVAGFLATSLAAGFEVPAVHARSIEIRASGPRARSPHHPVRANEEGNQP